MQPVLRGAHVQVQVDAAAQQLLDVGAGLGSDLLEARTLAADDDGLLGVALDVDVHVNVEHGRAVVALAAGALDDLLDLDGQGVRQLVAHAFEGGLADELRNEGVARLVGNVALGVERRRQRHRLREDLLIFQVDKAKGRLKTPLFSDGLLLGIINLRIIIISV